MKSYKEERTMKLWCIGGNEILKNRASVEDRLESKKKLRK